MGTHQKYCFTIFNLFNSIIEENLNSFNLGTKYKYIFLTFHTSFEHIVVRPHNKKPSTASTLKQPRYVLIKSFLANAIYVFCINSFNSQRVTYFLL